MSAPVLQDLNLNVSSNWINVINFLIFDIALISSVYFLTSDVMGRLNDAALRDGQPHRLIISSPPVLGGGLCSTHRVRVSLLLMARLLGLVLILATNLTIKGKTEFETKSVQRQVYVLGNVSTFSEDQFEEAVINRTGCLGNRNFSLEPGRPNETVAYYGEIRDTGCVTDVSLVRDPISLATDVINENMTTGLCPEYHLRTRNDIAAAEFFCETGTVQCLMSLLDPQIVDLRTCRAIIQRDNATFIAEEGAPWPEMPFEGTEARLVSGIDFRDRFWLDAIFINQDSIADAIHAAHFAVTASRQVLEQVEREVTLVSPLWFAAFGLKFILVLVLAITSLVLMRAGYRTVAHDEQRLAELLRLRLEENNPRLTQGSPGSAGPTIYLTAQPGPQHSGMIVSAVGRPGVSRQTSQQQQSDRNLQRHLDEARHY